METINVINVILPLNVLKIFSCVGNEPCLGNELEKMNCVATYGSVRHLVSTNSFLFYQKSFPTCDRRRLILHTAITFYIDVEQRNKERKTKLSRI